MSNPIPSPDGRTLAVPLAGGKIEEVSGLIDLKAPLPQRSVQYLPRFDETRGFGVAAWSPDGKKLVGALATATTYEEGVVIYSLESKKYERLSATGFPIAWLPDGRRVLYRDKNSLMTVDVETKKTQTVLDKIGADIGNLDLARDGRNLLAVRTDIQSDIWMLGPPEPTPSTP